MKKVREFQKQRVAIFIDGENNRIPLREQHCFPRSRRFRDVAEKKIASSRRVRSRSGSFESTHVLRDSCKVGTVPRDPLRLPNIGTLSHVQPLQTRVSNVGPLRMRVSEVCARTLFSVSAHTLFFHFLFCNITDSVLQILILFYNNSSA